MSGAWEANVICLPQVYGKHMHNVLQDKIILYPDSFSVWSIGNKYVYSGECLASFCGL